MSGRNRFFKPIKNFFSFLKGLLTFNVSTMLFGAIFFYMIITVIMYATSDHVTSYQVTEGPLTKNPVCTALALRTEQLVEAEQEGYADYYAREGMQIRKNGLVYAVDSQKREQDTTVELSEEQLEDIRSDIAKFSNGFNGNNFLDIYSFKYQLQGNILQNSGTASYVETQQILSDTGDAGQTTITQDGVLKGYPAGLSISLGSQDIYTAPSAGVVVYSRDRYEEKTADSLTVEDFDQKSYQSSNLLTQEKISPGDDVYKLITSEDWTLMIPLTDQLAATLAGHENVTVKFLKDGETQSGTLSLVTIGDQKTAKIELKNSMVRYASDRFLEVELLINTESGLKIPVSSIVSKEFYLIPRDFLTLGDNGTDRGFLREIQGGNGEISTEFVSTAIYREEDSSGEETAEGTDTASGGYCYVDKETLQEGDILKKPDSGETFTVGEIDYLEGVYCINKGYAEFRQIEILDQNEEYCIVSSHTPYGLTVFDSIVQDGESVHEEDILY